MSSPKAQAIPEVPNPYELAEGDAQMLGFVDFDLKTLELDKEFNVDANLKTEGDVSNITRDIVNSLLESSDPIAQIMSNYDRKPLSKNQLVRYFQFILTRLQQPDVNYLNLHDDNPEYDSELFCDFASFGARFWQVLTDSKLFSCDILLKLSNLIYRYLKLYPQEILKLREGIVKARLQLVTNPPTKSAQLKLIIDKALKPIDNCKLFVDLTQIKLRHGEPFHHFEETVGAPLARMELTEELRKVIESIFSELKPELVQVGGNASVNIDYRTLQFRLSFGIAGLKILDRSTRSMVMTPIVQVMAKMGLTGAPCNRSVVFNIDESKLDEYDRKLVISVCSDSLVFSKLVDFYIRYDARFGPMVLMLKYYVTEFKLSNCNRAFINEPIIWLIICFLLQTEPAVLLSFDALCSQTEEKSSDELVHFCTDLDSFKKSSNYDSIGELVVKFIDWFCNFKFDKLDPCDSSIFHIDQNFCFVYELKMDRWVVKLLSKEPNKDVNQWKNLFSKLKNDFIINSNNYLLVLANPECFKTDSDKLSYMNREPQNPFLLKFKDVDELEYPEDVGDLMVEPKFNPFENAATSNYFDDCQFVKDFIFTTKSINEILKSYNNDNLKFHYENVIVYFQNLLSHLEITNLSYDRLIDSNAFSVDYISYGERFWQWLTECKLFPVNYLRNYSILIYRYLEKFPQSILIFRTLLRDVYLDIDNSVQEPNSEDKNRVIFTIIDKFNLHKEITCKNNSREKLDYLLNQVYQRNQSKRCTDFIIEMITSDEHLKPLKLSLEQSDVLHGDFNLANLRGILNFYVKFNDITDKLDWATFVMALQLIEKSIERRFSIKNFGLTNSDFYFKIRSKLKFQQFDTFMVVLKSINTCDYTKDYLYLISEYLSCFGEILMLIYFWFEDNDGNFGVQFTECKFDWLIVHFLQQTTPQVLPPLNQLFEDGKLIKPSIKRYISTTKLVVQFFKFCTQFDFNNQVICPFDGVSYTKEEYRVRNGREEYLINSGTMIENPITKELFILTQERPDGFVKLVTKLLDEHEIDSENCIEILTDPSLNVEKPN